MKPLCERLSGPAVFVGGAWLALTAAAFVYVAAFAAPEFFGDEWDLVGGLTRSEPYLPWLWAQHNEHRLPLPKLVYHALLNASGWDARAGGLATVTILSILALGLVLAARRLRGTVEYADAFFPVLLLNWGHFEDFLMGFQVNFALSVGLVCVWLLSALGRRKILGLYVLLLPLCGAHGLIYVGPLGLATLWLGRQMPPARRFAAAGAVAAAYAITLYYFRGYVTPAGHPPSAGLGPSLRVAGEVLALGWGWAGQLAWPVSLLLSGAFLGGSAIVIGVAVRDVDRRDDAVALFAVFAGTLALALGVGWGRSGFGPLAGFAVRYALLAVPLMAAAYLAWVRFGGRVLGSLVPMMMFSVVGLLLSQHVRTGLSEGRESAKTQRAFADDLRRGLPPEELARRHPNVYPDARRLADRLRQVKSVGVPRYAGVGSQTVPSTVLTDTR